jgi:hypothetical protein
MALKEKAAYLKGLADGLDFDKTTAEGKLLAAILELLGEMTDAIDEIDEDLEYLADYTEELDKDLGELEAAVYEDECDCDCCDCDDCDYDCDDCECLACCSEGFEFEDEDEEEEEADEE